MQEVKKKGPSLGDYTELAESRSETYLLLSKMLSYEPLKDLAKMIKDGSILKGMDSESGEGARCLTEFVEEAKSMKNVREELEVEHTTLFIVGRDKNFRPFESLYLDQDKFVGGQLTRNVEKFYEKAGVGFTKARDELADHIGIELEFMHFLCTKEAEAWRSAKKEQALRYLALERDFLKEHLTKWAFEFCEDLLERTGSNFFKASAHFTKDYLEIEKNEIETILKRAEEIEV